MLKEIISMHYIKTYKLCKSFLYILGLSEKVKGRKSESIIVLFPHAP